MTLPFHFFITVFFVISPILAFAEGKEIVDSSMRLDVNALKKLTQRVPDTLVRQQLASGLDGLLSRYDQSNCVGKRAQPRRPATKAEIVRIENSMRSVTSPSSRRTTLLMAAQDHFFTTQQARDLTGLLSDESDRLIALEALYFRLVDPKNFHTLIALIASPDKQAELLQAIQKNKALLDDDTFKAR